MLKIQLQKNKTIIIHNTKDKSNIEITMDINRKICLKVDDHHLVSRVGEENNPHQELDFMKVLLSMTLFLAAPLMADPSACLSMDGCSTSPYSREDFGAAFYNNYGMSVSVNGDNGNFSCDGPCSTTHTDKGFIITDTSDGDTFEINCRNCTTTNNRDGTVTLNRADSGFWDRVRISIGISPGGPSGGISGPIPGLN